MAICTNGVLTFEKRHSKIIEKLLDQVPFSHLDKCLLGTCATVIGLDVENYNFDIFNIESDFQVLVQIKIHNTIIQSLTLTLHSEKIGCRGRAVPSCL